jgi:hypothetical protein
MPRLLLLLAVFFPWSGLADLYSEPLPPVALEHTERLQLTSHRIGQRFDLLVSLPLDYATSGKAYPVLYVIDDWHFPFMVFLQTTNAYSKRMPPVIMVAVSYGSGADTMALRTRDLTPTPIAGRHRSGGAAAFLDFLERDVIPLIDRTYRTLPADRGLIGHSDGGLFAVYAMLQRPALFQRIVAASPGLGWDGGVILKTASERLKAGGFAGLRLDLSAAAQDFTGKDAAAFVKLLDELKPEGLTYRFTVYPGENHNSVRTASFPSGLDWVYRQN